ncbi:glycosyltransferase [uncultured Bacteroides sp.]|uniref:glycosyltransferase n=1 Tax=uncultured Bacteroides sp. TaxID=162156 RepID=UPI002AAB2460|nr:glycosyltransferase [uncultured Bacteroides sp.]
MHPRLLIVGTVPYNTKSSSRAFEAYFHNWEKENLAQIFSDPKTPVKGHCGTLFQITDYRLLQSWKGKRVDTGVIYKYEDLPDDNESKEIVDESKTAASSYKFGAKHSPLTHLLRGLLWGKNLWCTNKLNEWLDKFKPESVFLSFSDDYFISQIAFYVAKRYNIPIVSSIGDDYIFNLHFSLNPIYLLYKLTYRSHIRKVLAHKGSAIYISNKIRNKYNKEFGLDGETVYLASTTTRKPFASVNMEKPLVTYFGNIRMGRNYSLNDIGYALGKINTNYKLEVYSGEKDPNVYGIFRDNPNIIYGGTIPYEEVQNKMVSSDITVIVEGFKKEDIDWSRYSLSTKAADALASGVTILTYGSQKCGIIEYMQSTEASFVCTEKDKLEEVIREALINVELQEQYYAQQIVMTKEHHNLQKSCEVFECVVQNALRK